MSDAWQRTHTSLVNTDRPDVLVHAYARRVDRPGWPGGYMTGCGRFMPAETTDRTNRPVTCHRAGCYQPAKGTTRPMTTHVLDQLTDPLIGPAYAMYERAFRPQAHLAANRHLMTSAEFLDVCADRKIEKHLVTDSAGNIAGFGAITRHLDRVPLIEPAYFAHHYPDDVAADRAWYVIFAATDRSPGILRELLLSMSEQARAAGGAVFMDFSAHNVRRQLPKIAERILAEHSWSLMTRDCDAQRFWAFEFSTPDQPLRTVR